MASLDLEGRPLGRRQGRFPLTGFRQILAALRHGYRRRRTLARISSLNEHLLRDVGFDPDDVRDALRGEDSSLWEKWENLHGKLVD